VGATLSNEEICQMVHPTRDEAIFPRNRSLFGGAGALDLPAGGPPGGL